MRLQKSPFLRLLGFATPLSGWIALSVLLGVATIGSGVGLLAASAWIIASAALQPSIAVLQVAIVGVRFFGITRGIFRYLERLVSHQVTFRLLARFRVWFYERLEPLAPAVLLRYRSGDLLSRVVADVATLENFYVRVIAPPLVALVTALGMGLFFGGYDARLALVLLAFLAAAGVGLPLLAYAMSRAPGRGLPLTRSKLNAALVDGIQGLPDLLAYGQAPQQLKRIEHLSRSLGGIQRRTAAIRGLQTGLGNLLASLAVIGIVVGAIPMVRAARLSGIDLAVLALATAACFEAVLPLPLAAQHLESSLAAALRLFDIADAQPAVPEERGQPAVSFSPAGAGAPRVAPAQSQQPPTSLAGAVIEVRDLRFSYEGSTLPALDGLSFSARAGQSVAIVGPSGAGKSTLVSLLLRFWDYRQGTILLAGRDLRSYPAEDVRRQIGVVAQGTHLFNATVRDNLLLARPDASQMALERAARAAEIHEFIAALPEGYETWIGEGGLRLSGGERQRLAIARALLKDAPVLILDEATANLDPLTERAVLGAIGRLMAGRTTLIITHRIAGLEMADEVLVLAGGRIVERGAHAALLAQHGLYHALWSYEAQTFAVEGFSPRAGVSGG